jgi:hypothetical protein
MKHLRSNLIVPLAFGLAITAGLAGCRSKGELVVDEGVGVTAVRSVCPATGIPDYTGDVTLFGPGGDQSADNVDLVAAMTNLRSQCNDGSSNASGQVLATTSFDVLARRNDSRGARQVVLPYYVVVLRGGNVVVTKRIGQVVLNFADGQDRAQARAQGSATIDRAEATLSKEIRDRITRKRKAGDEDAAIDPLNEPEVKTAIARATFEVLVGFQLSDDQLAYNATR